MEVDFIHFPIIIFLIISIFCSHTDFNLSYPLFMGLIIFSEVKKNNQKNN